MALAVTVLCCGDIAQAGWKLMPEIPPGNCYDMWGSSASDVYCVSTGYSDGYSITQLFHFDGNAWSTVFQGSGTLPHRKIWGNAANDIFVVGDSTVVLHFDGGSWTEMPLPHFFSLEGVWGSSGSDVFAVGRTSGTSRGVILHYDGVAWSEMVVPPSRAVHAVWGSSGTDVFAASEDRWEIFPIVNFMHFDGTSWSLMPPPANTNTIIYGLWGSSGADVFAVGWDLLHWDGLSWSRMSKPSEKGLYTQVIMEKVWGTSGSNVFATGRTDSRGGGTFGGILHFDGKSWSRMYPNPRTQPYALWGSGAADIYAPVSKGLLHYDGQFLTVKTPKNAGNQARGVRQRIRWVSNVQEGNVTITLHNRFVRARVVTRATPNDGTASWIVPVTLARGTRYRIKVEHLDDASIVDFSEGFFTIY